MRKIQEKPLIENVEVIEHKLPMELVENIKGNNKEIDAIILPGAVINETETILNEKETD